MKLLERIKVKIIKAVLHVQDKPDSIYGREWRWWMTTSSKPFALNLEFQLIRWEGKPQPPRLVGIYSIIFYLNPRSWKIESYHSYYDGPNCHWQFGPIGFGRGGLGNCSRCLEDTKSS